MPSDQQTFYDNFKGTITELIRRASTTLPPDVLEAIKTARADSGETPRAAAVLLAIEKNAKLASTTSIPMCQDTGSLTFWVETPVAVNHSMIADAIRDAVAEATRLGCLRQNTIMPVDSQSVQSNVADGSPLIHFDQTSERSVIRVSLLLKGGGCENMSTQYSLPDTAIKANRDLDGVRACVLHTVWCAQGMGCAPGIIGVCIGGDRAEGYARAKKQLMRELSDISPDPTLAALEQKLLMEANTLGIGPMGLGGNTTLLGVKLCGATRLPASFFVTVAYSCWACRRQRQTIDLASGLPIESEATNE